MKPQVVEIRRHICRHQCTNQCPEYLRGEIDHRNPCIGCPVRIWDAIEEPGCQPAEEPPPRFGHSREDSSKTVPKFSKRPGSLLKYVIWKLTGVIPCSACSSRSKQMNEWGWWKCWKNRSTITEWLIHEAESRGHKIEARDAYELFKAAWKEALR